MSGEEPGLERGEIMTTRSPSVTAASGDYTYEMQVHVPPAQIIEALTDDTVISRWWTAVTRSERHGDDVQLFMGGDTPAMVFTVEHTPATSEVTWTVTDCAVMADWVGTKPSFAVQPSDDGTFSIAFRHVGLNPALECFDQCRAGWNHFMPSLHQFLETGEGRPNEPRDASA
jgi:uncharacterized protein YndB with AHSA1/START domain